MTKTQHPIDAKCKALGIKPPGTLPTNRDQLPHRGKLVFGKRKSPDVYQLWKVARFLGVHIEDLLDPAAIADDSNETE